MVYFLAIFICIKLIVNQSYASTATLPDSFPLNQITLVGAHNAAMSTAEGWVYAQQSLDLEGLFAHGARFFKIPLQWYHPQKGAVGSLKLTAQKVFSFLKGESVKENLPFIALCHEYPGYNNCAATILQRGGKAPQEALQFFQKLAVLAEKNPKEIIILKIESYLFNNSEKNGTKNYSQSKIIDIFKDMMSTSGLDKFAYKLRDTNKITLGDLRQAHQNVIILINDNLISSQVHYLNIFNDFFNQSHWSNASMKNCKMANLSSQNHLTEININPEASIQHNSIEGRILSGINKVGINTGPAIAADYRKIHTSENIQNRLYTCENNNQIRGNILSSDHIQHGDLKKFADQRNQEVVRNYIQK